MTRRRRSVEGSLRAIVLSVLALPGVAAAACDRAADAPGAEGDGGPEADPDPLPPEGPDIPPEITGPCAPVYYDASVIDDSGCSRFLRLPCGLEDATMREECIPTLTSCTRWCRTAFRCQLAPDITCIDGSASPDADMVIECLDCANSAGRRPRGLAVAGRPAAASPLGDYFARLAYLEAASVIAFRDLEAALTARGAPRALRKAAARAADDERRHEAATASLARRFGAATIHPRTVTSRPPTLEELLVDDAVEGCVGESFGAMLAMCQGERASDEAIADVMREIARDEARHAALSWALLRWGAARLDRAARARVHARLLVALDELLVQVERPVDTCVADRAGYPPPELARELAARFAEYVLREAEPLLCDARSAG
jgi:hypothetical protein